MCLQMLSIVSLLPSIIQSGQRVDGVWLLLCTALWGRPAVVHWLRL